MYKCGSVDEMFEDLKRICRETEAWHTVKEFVILPLPQEFHLCAGSFLVKRIHSRVIRENKTLTENYFAKI